MPLAKNFRERIQLISLKMLIVPNLLIVIKVCPGSICQKQCLFFCLVKEVVTGFDVTVYSFIFIKASLMLFEFCQIVMAFKTIEIKAVCK